MDKHPNNQMSEMLKAALLPESIFQTLDEDDVEDFGVEPPRNGVFKWPMVDKLGPNAYHAVLLEGNFDVKALANDYRTQLFRSEATLSVRGKPLVSRLLFLLEDGIYVYYVDRFLKVYASTPQMAARVVSKLRRYIRPPKPKRPGFHLLRTNGYQPYAEYMRSG